MSKELYFRCRRFVDLDDDGNEVEDESNYGYTISEGDNELSITGMKRNDLEPLFTASAEHVAGIIAGIIDDRVRYSFEHALGYGICRNGRWL